MSKTDETEEHIAERLKEEKQMIDELVAQADAGITKLDYLQVMVEALMLLHPEVKNNPNVIAFMTKLSNFKFQN